MSAPKEVADAGLELVIVGAFSDQLLGVGVDSCDRGSARQKCNDPPPATFMPANVV